MAINWGTALGAAAKTGIETYERLGEEEMRQMQREKMRKDLEQEKALDTLYAEKLGKVGQEVSTYTPDMKTPEAGHYPEGTEPTQALPSGRAGANYVSDSDGMPLQETKSVYTQKQALADIAREAGVVGGRKGGLEAMQYKTAARASELEDKFDASTERYNKRAFEVTETLNTKGLSKLPDVINPSLKEHGMKAVFNEKTGAVNIIGKDGKVVEAYTDIASAEKAAHTALGGEWQRELSGLLGGPDKVLAYLNQREKLDIERTDSQNKGVYYKAEGNLADARASTLREESVLKKELRDTRDYYAKKIAALPANDNRRYELAQEAEAALAMTSGNFSKIAANTPMGRVLTQFDNAVKAHSEGKLAEKPNLRVMLDDNGFAAPSIVAAVQGDKEALKELNNGKPFTEAQIKQIKNKYRNTDFNAVPASTPAPSSAIPAAAPTAAPTSAIPAAKSDGWGSIKESSWAQNLKSGRVDTLEKKIASETNPRAKLKLQSELSALKDTISQ